MRRAVRTRSAVISGTAIVLLVGCGTDPRAAVKVEDGFRDDVLAPLTAASLSPTVTGRAADTVCDASGRPSDSGWILSGDVAVAAAPSAVAAALRPRLAVVERRDDDTYILQERRADPIGWYGTLQQDGQGGSVVHVTSNVSVGDGEPKPAWSRSC